MKQEWGEKPCEHPALAKEYDLGKRTGNYVCTQCGTTFTFREKAEKFGVRSPEPESSHSGGFMKFRIFHASHRVRSPEGFRTRFRQSSRGQ